WARRNIYKYCAVPCSLLVLAFCDIILRIRNLIEIMSFVAVAPGSAFEVASFSASFRLLAAAHATR
ncbi:hypothetical protein P692DRAFT_20722424, partial [Suillus brevipes Sb2]